MLEDNSVGNGLAATRDFFTANGKVWAVFGISTAEIGWNTQKTERISYCFVNLAINRGYVCSAHIGCFSYNAVSYFPLESVINGPPATDASNNIYSEFFAGVKVNFVLGVLVFTDAHCRRLPTV